MKDLEKIIILTGGSRGIGHATSKKFWDDGWTVITFSRSEVAPQCPWSNNKQLHFQVDLENQISLDKALIDLKKFLNGRPVKALINNAAISPKKPDNTRLGFTDTDLSLWRQVFNVNFFAPIKISQSIIKNLKLAKGVIINVTSIASDNVHQFAGPAYATSKAALKSLTREMASDLANEGIRVNAIAPGEVKTAILSEGTEKIVADIPMKRLGLPEEVADTIFYLCSKEASYVSGAEIEINGGQHV